MTRRGELVSAAFALAVVGASVGSCAVVRELPIGGAARAIDWLCPVLGVLMLAVIVLAGMHLLARRWVLGVGSLASLAVSAMFSALVLLRGGVDLLFVDEDHFADDLVIPPDLVFREPGSPSVGAVDDPTGAALVAAAEAPRSTSPSSTVNVAVPSRAAIDASRLDALRAWLAASPFWHVGWEQGRPIAYRRFVSDPSEGLHDTLNGYYSVRGDSRRGWRVALGFGGPAFTTDDDEGVLRTRASSGSVELVGGPSGDSFADPTSVLILDGPLVVEIFERGPDADRPLTRGALALVESTLAAFLRGETPVPTARGAPRLDLSDGIQPGTYHVTAMVNPGEPGTAYVRAFEVTHETQLSASRIRERTARQLASSTDPTELFQYEAELTVYEGNWGQFYAARFELWFAPQNGGPERMLISDVFRIQGWMR